MPTAWRIIKTRYADHAWDGEGTRSQGGRWTSPGKPAVYVAESISLATLEILVHLQNPSTLALYSLASVSFPDSAADGVPASTLSRRWRDYPAPPELQQIGDQWLELGKHAVLQVPSAVVPAERNYLLNPAHPDFKGFKFSKPQPYVVDTRLLSRR